MSNEIDFEGLKWLLDIPSGDGNFKTQLAQANKATIRTALARLDENEVTKKKALERQLKKLVEQRDPAADEAATKEALIRANQNLAMATGELLEEQKVMREIQSEQEDREKRIAQVHQVIGRVQANMLMSKFADVGSLVWMKEVKESKLYRDLPEVGTWDNFCKSIGLSRQKVDEDLQNLAVFGEEFLLMGRRFSLGYQDLRKLRQLTHDGAVIIEGECLVIADESIPIDQDHADELQAAIEKIIEDKSKLTQRVEKLEKDFSGAVKEETKGLQQEKKALLAENKRLQAFDPQEQDREWSVKQMIEIEKATDDYTALVGRFIIDPRLNDDRNLQARVSGHLQEAEMMLHDLRRQLDGIINMFND